MLARSTAVTGIPQGVVRQPGHWRVVQHPKQEVRVQDEEFDSDLVRETWGCTSGIHVTICTAFLLLSARSYVGSILSNILNLRVRATLISFGDGTVLGFMSRFALLFCCSVAVPPPSSGFVAPIPRPPVAQVRFLLKRSLKVVRSSASEHLSLPRQRHRPHLEPPSLPRQAAQASCFLCFCFPRLHLFHGKHHKFLCLKIK